MIADNSPSPDERAHESARPLVGKTAVVTGGASGIGLAISQRLARDGANIAVFDVDAAASQGTQDLNANGHRATGHTVDVSDRDQVDHAVDVVHERFGVIHILVNNAGIECVVPFTSMDEATWNRIFAVNITGMFHCTQAIVPDMIDAGWGRVVNISSSSAQRGAPDMVAYSTSKGAVIAFTRSLALELGKHGITVNNIPPNFIDTPMMRKVINEGHRPPGYLDTQAQATPVGRAGQPQDIAAACAFLASPDAGYITAQTIGVNGGRFP